jgi:predicted PurR-regulated permease PerM
MKYLNANVEDAFGSLMTSLKIGGSVAFAVVGNAILIPVALFYLLMDWGRFVAYLRELIPPVCVPLPTASWMRRMLCWGSTCVGNCW